MVFSKHTRGKTTAFGPILLITVIVMEVNISLQQHCLTTVSSQDGYALVGKEYKTFITDNYRACFNSCKKDENCMSLNFRTTNKTCDLNTQTKESEPMRYKVRQDSIYSTNIAFRTPKPVKGMKEFPAKSCLDILVSGESIGTSVYWIDPANTGSPIQAFCDMTTDGGGWTTVKRSILQIPGPPPVEEVNDTYQVIAEFDRNDKWIIPTGAAMLDILRNMGFHQIQFYCHKMSVGRVVSIMTRNNTAGQDVVRYFTNPEATSNFPAACGSFDRLPEDTSVLAQNCSMLGTSKPPEYTGQSLANKWGYYSFHAGRRLGTIPFQANIPPKHFFGFANLESGTRGFCDDDYDNPSPYSANDIWHISVR